MVGQFLVPLSAEHRKNSGITGGESVEVTLIKDKGPGTLELPDQLKERF